MFKHRDVHAADMANNPAYREAYEALSAEFACIAAGIEARSREADVIDLINGVDLLSEEFIKRKG